MSRWIARFRAHSDIIAVGCASAIAWGVLLWWFSHAAGGHGAAARRAVAGVIAVGAFGMPLGFACCRSARDLARLGAVVLGCQLVLSVFCIALDPGAVSGSMLALLYVGAVCVFAFGLSLALGCALGSPAAGRAVAVAGLVVAATTTFTASRLYEGLDDSPELRRGIVRLTIGANPFLMANRVLSEHSRGEGDYHPIQGPVLYDMWIGTSFSFSYPSGGWLALRWLVLGVLLAAAGAWGSMKARGAA